MTIDYNTPTVPPLAGKRFVMRNGEVTGEFRYFIAKLPNNGDASWYSNGLFYPNETRHPYDIIAVYEPPAAAKPRYGWLNEYSNGFSVTHRTKEAAINSASVEAVRVAVRYVETPEAKEEQSK